ncbi:gamma-glutamyl-gamma-aminobutyrate hydrolase family protein [Galbitalea sp. SE-J8]|uniref:gamma-glutamyl-gamma-aminobutyrate hydrolase family protein n=1 Tax=Galbitalea sp. SE-J8 TaxID=3054952 RepID=UPI00259D0435|nr:gamma-glutamyl-gamma-aminobutyrate hydrolase family protein [Galbitalea sp. SE-J8]MDM4762684.1 gamma-glutamyl-gamma-aminobutyrate hydrolase family protein [Galbitalea sp. SE-J8]
MGPRDRHGSTAPLIGLTTYLERAQQGVWDGPASFLPRQYFDAVTRAGGIAVLLPPQPVDAEVAASVLDAIDGLIVTGGKDVDPARYGQEPHPTTDAPRLDRDAWEDALLAAAIERELPFLGICRGLQVLNVTRGGTLLQHLPDVVGSDRYNLGGGVFATNEVSVDDGTRLADLLERSGGLAVKSYHHQAVDRVGEGLRVSARTDDGTIQAVELTTVPFGVAVQWHPEETLDDLRLFAGLVDAARAHRSARSLGPAARSLSLSKGNA